MEQQLHRARLLLTFGQPFFWAVVLLFIFQFTNPLQNGPLSVLTVFILIYLLCASLLYLTAFIVIKTLSLVGVHTVLGLKTTYYLVSVLGLAPVFLIALNTLGHLEIKDVILVALLVGVGCFYVLRRRGNTVG